MLDYQESAGQADVDNQAELFHGQLGDQPDTAEAGGVDDDVERTRPREQRVHRLFIGDLNGRRKVRIAKLRPDAVRAVGVAVGDSDAVLIGGQRMGHRPADA